MAGTTRKLRSGRTTRQSFADITGREGYVPITTGSRRGVGPSEKVFPDPPPSWRGTLPEWAIFWAHLALGRRENEDFIYLYYTPETPNGIDFFELGENLGIEIQGLFWHYGFGAAKQSDDIERRIRVESLGIHLIFIDEDAAIKDPIYFLKEAINGRDHSLSARGAA